MKNLFLSHDWGVGDKNHERVVKLNGILADYLTTWLDVYDLEPSITDSIHEGIDISEKIVVFVTRAYMRKASGEGPTGLKDYCYKELKHILEKHESENIILVLNEICAHKNGHWTNE